jgi:hypothetical protein
MVVLLSYLQTLKQRVLTWLLLSLTRLKQWTKKMFQRMSAWLWLNLSNITTLSKPRMLSIVIWGGAGVYADGSVLRVAGVQIVKTNNLPTTNVTAVSGENNTYNGDFSNTAALVMQKQAIGTVKLMDLAVEQTTGDFNIMYQGTLMAAKYAMGHGVLRPECAVEIKTA